MPRAPVLIPEEKIEQVRQATDIVEVISQYVPLKRAGKNLVGLCPFHKEKTPSFSVNPEKQFYKCFGCGEGGDVFTFLMRHDRLAYPEAVRLLAERRNIDITPASAADPKQSEQKALLYQINQWAATTFRQFLLTSPEGKQALEYLEKRHISREASAEFKIGYSLPAWDSILTLGKKEGYAEPQLEKAGLVIRRSDGSGYYDRFRNRLMFPIQDAQERVIGFGARTLADEEPKYLNSPETPLFSKGSVLYGIAPAKQAMQERRRALIMEGYTDVIMAHQHGLRWAVAVLGTALGAQHVAVLRRYADEVTLVFDADTAGRKSSDRSLDVFVQEDLSANIAILPEGADPCDLLVREGAAKFQEVLDKAVDLLTFKLNMARASHDVGTISGRTAAAKSLLATVARCPDIIKRDLLVKRISEELGIRETVLRDSMRQSGSRGLETPAASANSVTDAQTEAERALVEIMLHCLDLIPEIEARMARIGFQRPQIKAVAEGIFRLYAKDGQVEPAELTAILGDAEQTRIVVDAVTEERHKGDYAAWLQQNLAFLEKRSLRLATQTAREGLLKAAKGGDPTEEARFLAEFHRAHKAMKSKRQNAHGL